MSSELAVNTANGLKVARGRLACLDPKPPVIRYQREHPGELIHIDTKKLGRIDGIGHRITGDPAWSEQQARDRMGGAPRGHR